MSRMQYYIPPGFPSVTTAALLLLCTASGPARANDIYVDGLSGNDGAAGTTAAPLKTPARAIALAAAGDVVHLRPTTVYSSVGIFSKSGATGAYITVKGDGVAPNLTKLRPNGTNFGIQVNNGAHYIAVEDFDVQAAGNYNAVFVGNASTHVVVAGNVVHDTSVTGIGTSHADYLTIADNVVYGNAHYTGAGVFGSGISTYENVDSDGNTGVKSVIDGNIVYANTNTPTPGLQGGKDPDGSGIIVDDSRHTQDTNIPYHGRTLIENNVVFGNGGRGIYMFESDHVRVENNTTYRNNQDPYEGSWRPGEIMVEQGGGDIDIYNNIMVSDGAAGSAATGPHTALTIADANDGVGSVVADYNLAFAATNSAAAIDYLGVGGHTDANPVTLGIHNQFADPLFVAPGTNPATANFRLQPGSPALGAGDKAMAAKTDVTGATRPASIDLGAYQQTP